MAKTTTVPGALVPYEAGVVAITPLDSNFRPMYEHTVLTQENFLQSTQLTETVTTEEIENGNGQNKTLVTARMQNLAVTSNVYNKVFHNMAAGNIETLPSKANMPTTATWNLPSSVPTDGGLQITFGADADIEKIPAVNDDGDYFLVVEDSYGNPLVRRETPEKGAFSWDSDTKTISFSDDYVGQQIRLSYEYESTNIIRYESNPILSQKMFQIDTFGITVDPNTDVKVRKHERMKRATLTGDVPGIPSQKSRATSMVYNFQSAPMPLGVSGYFCDLEPIGDTGEGTDAGLTNIVNGGDDNFTSKP